MEESRLELKVGAFVLVALAAAVALIVVLSGIGRAGGFTLNADFGYGAGLQAGALVKIAGVKAGRVKSVEFRPEQRDPKGRATPVRFVCDVDASMAVSLREDAQATVGQQGALGEAYLEIDPGVGARRLASGDAVRGLDPPRLDVVLARLAETFEAATREESFYRFLSNVADLAEGINVTFNKHDDGIGLLLKDAGVLLADAQDAVKDVRRVARTAENLATSDELQSLLKDAAAAAKLARAELPGFVKEARALVAELDAVAKTAGKLGPEDVAKLKDTLGRFERIAKEVEAVTEGVDGIVSRIERGDGTVGQLVKDPKVYEDLRALLADLKAHPWKFLWKE